MNQKIWVYSLIFLVFTFFLIIDHDEIFAWHENLDLNNTQASELYKSNYNDPLIKQWQDGMMNEINQNKKDCLDELKLGIPRTQDVVEECITEINIILANCDTHPNALLACKDLRFKKYILTQGKGEGFPPIVQEQQPKNVVPIPQAEEQQLVDLCAQYFYDKRESPFCQDLSPELKEKIQIEAQKLEEKLGTNDDLNFNFTPPIIKSLPH